ncbi:hypothetical protein [Ferrovum sp.]|uniref:TubC N-terminal docking domain-related protein n=1 Tax=Ferrovum sp. TaxID=2609467 RepID=UPI00260F5555|nr:hypothetical protein [Ferrovum sp.]
MGAFDLIQELRGAGVIVRADGGELDVSPADLLTDENIKALKRHKLEILALLKVGAGDTATASRWWRIHYPDRVVEVSFNPEATHAEVILEWYPDAVAAEPFTQNPKPESEFESAPSETGQEIVQKAVALASEVPDVPRGIFVDEYSDLENVVLFVADLAIRQTFQMLVPREKYDPLALLVLVENLQDGTRIRWSGEGPMRLPHWPSGESVAASGPHACTCPACSN